MTKGRDTVAENLGDVLELIRARRQSGLLSVERMQGGRFEEGEIYFQHGQPVYARTGQMVGQEAIVWLLSWHSVYFTFSSEESRSAANIPSTNNSQDGMAIPVGNGSSSQAFARRPLPDTNQTNPALNWNRTFPNTSPEEAAGGVTYSPNAMSAPASTPGLEWLVPQKLGKDRDVLSLPLTPPQPSIYMLIDGRRSTADLARCTRKSLQEIERLLSELQERGLIKI